MAFDKAALSRYNQVGVAAGQVISKYQYATADAVATVETAAYFTDSRLRKGDTIDASMVLGGTPVLKSYICTAVTNAGVATIAAQTTA